MADSPTLTVHHVFRLRALEPRDKHGLVGLEGFLRGSVALWQIVQTVPGMRLTLCTHSHPALRHLVKANGCTADSADAHVAKLPFFGWQGGAAPVREFLESHRTAGLPEIHLSTDIVPLGWPDCIAPECAAFLRENLWPTDLLWNAIVEALGAQDRGEYDVLHIHAGDPVGSRHLPPHQRSAIAQIVRKHIPSSDRPLLVIADDVEVGESIAAQHGLSVRARTRACDLGQSVQFQPGDLQSATDTMVDFFLIAHAGRVFQISTGSTTFSDAPALMFCVPMQRWRI